MKKNKLNERNEKCWYWISEEKLRIITFNNISCNNFSFAGSIRKIFSSAREQRAQRNDHNDHNAVYRWFDDFLGIPISFSSSATIAASHHLWPSAIYIVETEGEGEREMPFVVAINSKRVQAQNIRNIDTHSAYPANIRYWPKLFSHLHILYRLQSPHQCNSQCSNDDDGSDSRTRLSKAMHFNMRT